MIRKHRRPTIPHVAVAALVLGFVSISHHIVLRALAEDAAAGRAEMEKAFRSLAPRPSLDTYLVDFSDGGIHFRVPRNYLTTMDNWNGGPQAIVTLTVNLPDLKPLSQDTLNCFTSKAPNRPLGCEPFSFRINGSGGPSANEVFERFKKDFFHDQTPTLEPSGLAKYEYGPATAPIGMYKIIKGDQTRLYSCFFDGSDQVHGVCQPISDSTTMGAVIKFFFSPKHLSDIVEIDANLHKLVESFTVQPESGK
jgi:hypothetical protein